MPRVIALLEADVDEQRTTPLAIIRDVAVPLLTSTLQSMGAPVPDGRDPFLRERFPDDVYALTPAGWADVDESLVAPGIAWGAAKAWTHKARHS